MSRCLLAQHKLEDFKRWLDSKDIAHRPGKDFYQVLQVRVGSAWQVIYFQHDKTVHYTVPHTMEFLVRRFINESKELVGEKHE